MVTISLCMIVRDEEAVLGRCLECVKGIADEIVIVDTGSLDKTKKTAARYTDRIYDFPWQDDFSAARNFSFSKASMDYCMWLDADDVITPENREKIISWKKNADHSADVVMMRYVTDVDKNEKPVFSYFRERILKRACGFLWEGCVHEVIVTAGNVEYLDAQVDHRKIKEGDSYRNLQIYEKMLKKGQLLDAREMFYYARELFYHSRYEDAVENFEKFLAIPGTFVENQVEACRIAAYSCYYAGKEAEALDFLMRGLTFRVPGGELCCDLGKHFYDREQWEWAAFWYEAALHAPKKDRDGGFVREECYGYLPCVQLSVCYYRLGKYMRAKKWHKKAGEWKPYGEEFLQNEKYFS